MSTVVQRTRVAAVAAGSAGSLVVQSGRYCQGTVTARLLDDDGHEGRAYYVETQRQKSDEKDDFNRAEFPVLPAGNYGVSRPGAAYTAKKVTVFPGLVTHIDFR